MANSKLQFGERDDPRLQEALDLLVAHDNDRAKAARAAGIPYPTFSRRVQAALERNYKPNPPLRPAVALPEFPEDDVPVEDIIDMQVRRFEKRRAATDAHTWFSIKFRELNPVGIVWFGDPHVDDNGCNWPLLKHHVELCAAHPNVYGVNIGDVTNNWTGRLMKLYAEQDTSIQTARRLVEWLMLGSGIQWLVWILGNHDTWNDGAEVLAQMGKRYGTRKLICHDWEARFVLDFPDWSVKVFASHDFKGHSQWNPLHGPMKAGQMGEDADIYVAGHRHNWARFVWENTARGSHQTFIRVRGYKELDSYARRLGIAEQREGAAAITVFDPAAKRHTTFEDIEDGIKFMQALTSRDE